MGKRIVVTIAGGCLQSVYCDDPEAKVKIIDWDDYDGDVEEADALLEEAIVGLTEVY